MSLRLHILNQNRKLLNIYFLINGKLINNNGRKRKKNPLNSVKNRGLTRKIILWRNMDYIIPMPPMPPMPPIPPISPAGIGAALSF